jgi:glycosyltransferase involved in cell wall biosynthesis
MSEKIKILRIFSRLNIGGPAIHTILLTAGLNNDQFESILVKGSEDPSEGDMLYLAKEKGVEPIVIPEMGRNISWRDEFNALLKIYRLIKEEKPHIVHTHTAKAGTLGRGAAILVNSQWSIVNILGRMFSCPSTELRTQNIRIKLVHTFHGHVLSGYFGYIKNNIFLWVERFLGLFTDMIITVSEKLREEILGFRIGNKKKTISLPLGLELSKLLKTDQYKGLLREELGVSGETKLVAIIARLVPIKNHKMFIDGISMLKAQKLAVKVKFLVIGDGELRNELESYVKKEGLGEDIFFLGFRKDMEKIYADLDMVVLTSLNEGSPVALIEAMAAGKAVVSTDVGGVVDLIGNEDQNCVSKDQRYSITNCGVLLKSADADVLAGAMKELLKNEYLGRMLGAEGRKRVYPRYDITRLVKDIKQLYEELLN